MSDDSSRFDKYDLFRKLDVAWLRPLARAGAPSPQLPCVVDALVAVTVARNRADAQAHFGLACIIIAICVMAIAIFMLMDDQKPTSHVALLLSLIPFVGGAWHLDCANREKRRIASELERLQNTHSHDA